MENEPKKAFTHRSVSNRGDIGDVGVSKFMMGRCPRISLRINVPKQELRSMSHACYEDTTNINIKKQRLNCGQCTTKNKKIKGQSIFKVCV